MRFTFEFSGQVQFDRAFNRIEQHIEDLRPVWDEVERAFYKIEEEQFASEGAKGRSGKWKELSSPYKEIKAKTHPGMPILQRSGKLQRSLTGNTSDSVLRKEKQEFAIGTKLFYAPFHMEGTKNMPAREPISLSDTQRTFLTKEIQKSLLAIIKKDRQVTGVVDVD
jgi:phage gpG-like protein